MSTSAELTTRSLEKKLKVEAFERARAQWRGDRAQRKASATHYTIALSRESGAAGTEVADEVGRLLKWPVYDRQLLEHIADEAGLRTQLLESLDEKRSHWLMETLQGFGQGSGMTGASYARRVAETILALAAHGRCIVVGRGCTVLVPPKTSLRVRLVASLDDRSERIRKRLKLSKLDAIKHVSWVDEQREGFVHDYFRHNAGDAHNYDLVLNTSKFAVKQAAQLIVEALQKCQQAANE